MRYVIEGNPIAFAWARTNNGRFYDAQAHKKLYYKMMIEKGHAGAPLFTKPLLLDIHFYFKAPKLILTKRNNIEMLPMSNKPDLDNCTKLVLDCCKGIVFVDDCLITTIKAEKTYGVVPRTEFDLWEI